MSLDNNAKRHIFPYQQSQIVIIDLDYEIEAFRNIMKALRDIISLTVSISGPSRIPSFGIIVLGQMETMFSLKSLKEYYEELLMFFNTCDSYLHSTARNVYSEGTVLKFLYFFIKQFNENDLTVNYNCDVSLSQKKLQFTVISNNINFVLRECREFCRNSNIRNVQRIHIIVPKVDESQVYFEDNKLQLTDFDNCYNELSVDEGVIEVTNLRNNHCVIFEDIFKNWLLDSSLESYHMEIVMRVNAELVISVKCDIQECIINPSTLPQASSILLEADYSVSRTISYAGNNKLKSVPIYQMEVVSQISLEGICESLIYGQPLLLKPTMCWRLEIEELTQSQIYFQEMCNQLTEANNGLILKRLTEKIVSYYLIIPANNYLILKCLSSKELLMPRKEISPISNITQGVQLQMKEFLDSLKYEEEYNPIFFESGIYQSNCLTNRKNKRSMSSAMKSNNNDNSKISFGFYNNC